MGRIETNGSLFSMLVGTNGTGKTTVLRKVMDAHRGRALALPSNRAEDSFSDLPEITMDQVGTFSGKARLMCYEADDFEHVSRHLSHCLLVSDDFRNYLPNWTLTGDTRRLFIDRRHKKIDIYMAAHGFNQVPPELFSWVNLFFLFKTTDNINRAKNKVLRPDDLIQAQDRVNREAERNPYYFEIIKNA